MSETKKTNTNTTKNTAKKTTAKKPKITEAEKSAKKAFEEEEKEKLRKKKLIRSEIISIIIIALGVFLILSLLTNACGIIGSSVKLFLEGVFSKVAYVLPFFMVILGVMVFAQKTALISWRSLIAFLLIFVFASAFFAAFTTPLKENATFHTSIAGLRNIYSEGTKSGGVIGVLLGSLLMNLIGKSGLYITSIVGIIICILFVVDTPISQLFDNLKLKAEIRKAQRDKKNKERMEAEIQKKIEEENAKAEMEKKQEEEAKQKELSAKQNKIPANQENDSEADNSKLKEVTLPSLNTQVFNMFDEQLDDAGIDFDDIADKIEEYIPPVYNYDGEDITENKRKILDYVNDDKLFNAPVSGENGLGLEESVDVMEKFASKTIAPGSKDAEAIEAEWEKAFKNSEESEEVDNTKPKKYKFPPIDLLKKNTNSKVGGTAGSSTNMSKLLEDTLNSFGVKATVVDVIKGPAVTRYEVQPAPGVQVSKIVHLQDDIALNLRAKSIRIEAPIPGKAAVGIEVSNDAVQTVLLRDLVDSKEFKNHKSKIAVTLGKSISGDNIVCDIHEMPHLLIAGTTGSGKSVCIDSMLVSLLYHAKPDEVKLILIDPKIVELAPFNGIPHLLIPVVTEPNKAAVALNWAVTEMDQRYNKFAEEGVKDLASYNESVKFNGKADLVMPEVVIVIDELADLIMASKNAVELSISRLAQKARAAGMHLIIATQRPSADIITGVIKANVPSRIALSVSSGIDSRVILDMTGAENLLGKGDMLYNPQSLSKPIRVQGTFISDSELHAVIDFVKSQAEGGEYNAEILNAMDKAGTNNVGQDSDDDTDELFMDALESVVMSQQCSSSMLQRRFRIGYNRAARLVDMMEERGIVGPSDGANKGRKVNMTEDEFREYKERTEELERDF